MAAPSITVTYLDVAARGFPIRFALRCAGLAFEDERVPIATLHQLRGPAGFNAAVPLGQLPVCRIDGRIFVESMVVSRWAAKRSSLYPADAMQQLVVDEAMAVLDECWMKVPRSADPEQLRTLRETFTPTIAPRFFAHLERRVKESGGPFVLGATLSIADIWVVAFHFQSARYDHLDAKGLWGAYPMLQALVDAVKAHELYKLHAEPL